MMPAEELQKRFTYHPPATAEHRKSYELVRSIALSYATVLNELVPDSREKALCLTKLEEVVFWANAGIARNNESDPVSE